MHDVTPKTTTWKTDRYSLKCKRRKWNTENILVQYSWENYYIKYLYSKTGKRISHGESWLIMQNTFYHRNNTLNDDYDVKPLNTVNWIKFAPGQESNHLMFASLGTKQFHNTKRKEDKVHRASFPNSELHPAWNQSF